MVIVSTTPVFFPVSWGGYGEQIEISLTKVELGGKPSIENVILLVRM